MLLPLPETPVTQTKRPRGILTSIFFKLYCLAPLIIRKSLLVFLTLGASILRFRDRYLPVSELGFFITSSGEPIATTFPP